MTGYVKTGKVKTGNVKTGNVNKWLAAAAIAALSGCGDDGGERILQVVTYTSDMFSAGDDGIETVGALASADSFTPEAVAANPDNYRLITINALGIAELAVRIMDNGSTETWVSQTGFTVTFADDILIATRGLLGEDIMATGAPNLRAALRAGGGTVNRAIETLDSLNAIQTMTFSCTVTQAGSEAINLGVRDVTARRFDEHCAGATLIFDNIYWVDNQGEIVASRQYVSPTVAYLRSNRL